MRQFSEAIFSSVQSALKYFDHSYFINRGNGSLLDTMLPTSKIAEIIALDTKYNPRHLEYLLTNSSTEGIRSAKLAIEYSLNLKEVIYPKDEPLRHVTFAQRTDKIKNAAVEEFLKLNLPESADNLKVQSIARFVIEQNSSSPAKYHISIESFKKACAYLPQVKPRDMMPNIGLVTFSIDEQEYTLRKLPHDDIRGFFIGKLTSCCQSIGDNGHEAALMSMIVDCNQLLTP